MRNPLVGLVMPAYNAARFLPEAVEAVRAQTYSSFVCCIVDDGSTDNTHALAAELVAGDPRFSLVSKPNGGVASARNFGLAKLPVVDYVTYPDADDIWLPHALQTLVAAVTANPDCIGAHALAEYVDEDGKPSQSRWFSTYGRLRSTARHGMLIPVSLDSPTTFANLAVACTMFPSAVALIRHDLFDRVGSYDSRCEPLEDWDMFLRLARHGDIAFVDDVVLHYRQHDANVSKNPAGMVGYKGVRVKTARSQLNTKAHRVSTVRAWRATELQIVKAHLKNVARSIGKGQWRHVMPSATRLVLATARAAIGRPSQITHDY